MIGKDGNPLMVEKNKSNSSHQFTTQKSKANEEKTLSTNQINTEQASVDLTSSQDGIDKSKDLEPLKVRNKIGLNYTLTLDSQYSLDTLYGSNQFSIGGEYTIRGFREGTISGDNGYYIRNDLRMSLQQLFPRALINTKPMNYGNKIKDKQYNLSINDALLRTSISIFYDFGYVKNKHKILPDY